MESTINAPLGDADNDDEIDIVDITVPALAVLGCAGKVLAELFELINDGTSQVSQAQLIDLMIAHGLAETADAKPGEDGIETITKLSEAFELALTETFDVLGMDGDDGDDGAEAGADGDAHERPPDAA